MKVFGKILLSFAIFAALVSLIASLTYVMLGSQDDPIRRRYLDILSDDD